MPFYIRKSINFGGVRLNLSKSGVGVSAGVKGFRVGMSPKGNYIHMGRNGFYYRKTLSNKKSKSKIIETEEIVQNDVHNMQDIDSGDVLQIVDSDNEDLVNELNLKRKKFCFSYIALVVSIVFGYFVPMIFVLGLFLVFVCVFIDYRRKTTIMFYSFDDEQEKHFKKIYNTFDKLKLVNRVWHIPQKGNVKDSKYHAGAGELVNRAKIDIKMNTPDFVKTNIPIPCIPVGRQKIYFFPDKILIFDKKKVGALSYKNIDFDLHTVRFIEEEYQPKDAKVIDTTWKYVNKKGGADKRFKDNRQLPIMEYEAIHIKSDTGLNELIYISKVGSFNAFLEAIK